MQVGTREFYEILENFERNFKHMRLDKESEEYWNRGQIYQNGETNNSYSAYILGYSFGRVTYMN
jgi:hypothetical protein